MGWSTNAAAIGRETFLVPVTWENDWPVFNAGKKVELKGEAPGLFQIEQTAAWRDDFEADELQLGWYRKSTETHWQRAFTRLANGLSDTPVKKDYSLTERPGYLRLYGGPYTLSTPVCPTMFLRKQTHDPVRWETRLSFCPDSPATEAGSTVYWNSYTYSTIGIRLISGGNKSGAREIAFRSVSGAAAHVPLASQESDVVLVIKSDSGYMLGFKEIFDGTEDQEVNWVGEVSSKVMTRDPEVGASFTGMTFGIYAFGETERCFVPADFKYVEFM